MTCMTATDTQETFTPVPEDWWGRQATASV